LPKSFAGLNEAITEWARDKIYVKKERWIKVRLFLTQRKHRRIKEKIKQKTQKKGSVNFAHKPLLNYLGGNYSNVGRKISLKGFFCVYAGVLTGNREG
jgi:hypothetical protein